MASRTGMLAARNRRAVGDPFFGALAKLAFTGIKKLVTRGGAKAAGRVVAAAPKAVARVVTGGSRTARLLRGAAGLGATVGAAALGTSLVDNGTGVAIDPETGLPFRRRRSINPLNPQAARRAVRRLCSLKKFTDKLEKSLASLAPKRRAAPRRHHFDPHHHHKG